MQYQQTLNFGGWVGSTRLAEDTAAYVRNVPFQPVSCRSTSPKIIITQGANVDIQVEAKQGHGSAANPGGSSVSSIMGWLREIEVNQKLNTAGKFLTLSGDWSSGPVE